MHARRHSRLADRQTDWLACDRHAVSDEIAVLLLLLLATAGVLALAGLAIVGVLNAIAWLVAQ